MNYRYLCMCWLLIVLIVALAGCGGAAPVSDRQKDQESVNTFTKGRVSIDGVKWLNRFAIDLGASYTTSAGEYLKASCNSAQEWHKINRHPRVNEDWIILAQICNLALADKDWAAAQRALVAARP